MVTLILRYRIRTDSARTINLMHEEFSRLCQKHAQLEVLFLRDPKAPCVRTDVIRFLGEQPHRDLERINQDPEIESYFLRLHSEVLDPECPEIQRETLEVESSSRSGRLDHIEIYCSDLKRSEEFWSWFLGFLGYKLYQKWTQGVSFKLGDMYLVLVQADPSHLTPHFHRRRPGLNHLAFQAASRRQVDELTQLLRDRQVSILYGDRHPHAGGSDSYAVFFEDPERIKVELIAPVLPR